MLSALRAFTFNPTNGDNKNTAHNVIETNAFLNIKNTSFINMNKVSNVCNNQLRCFPQLGQTSVLPVIFVPHVVQNLTLSLFC